jgi:ATP-dependent 26S proteasome regulatory subunit
MVMPKPSFNFENKIADIIIKEIHHFWKSADLFELFNQPHRRGVLLHGPAGTGKSTLVYRICHNVIENDGICIKFPDRITYFKKALKSFRDIHPDRPVFVLMEDLDELYKRVGLGGLTNVIDGTESQGYDNILYLATTNHLDQLPEVFTNRPSRFDMVVKIGSPDTQTRINFIKEFAKFYTDFSKKFPSFDEIGKDTKGFSFAHLKEMFLAVAIFNHSYKDSLKRMRNLAKVDVTAGDDD